MVQWHPQGVLPVLQQVGQGPVWLAGFATFLTESNLALCVAWKRPSQRSCRVGSPPKTASQPLGHRVLRSPLLASFAHQPSYPRLGQSLKILPR
jgi:hypothetical protein